ncbi:hypothetical protein HO539_07510 [Streptococcus suis]|nr:hypothetical protein [Streptococcus suis]NQJ73135.1 hypothetical protein [Streptococcus suis]NQJ77713.1 hypothetical protein [Streptococcus suis]NRG68622.1 hypothetical protein [Streptococcus suis]
MIKKNPCNNLKWNNPKNVPTFGHTFSEHGQKVSLESLKDRARNKGHQIGQFLDDQSAGLELGKIAQEKGTGVWDIPLPPTLLKIRVVTETGEEVIADSMRVIVKLSGGIKTAFPFNSSLPTTITKVK